MRTFIRALVTAVSLLLAAPAAAQVKGEYTCTVTPTMAGKNLSLTCTKTGQRPPPPAGWSRSGTGANIFNKPRNITRIRIRANYSGRSQNFVVWCRNPANLIVNEILGSSSIASGPTYVGIHNMPCRTVEVKYSRGIRWTFQQVGANVLELTGQDLEVLSLAEAEALQR